MSTPGVCYCGAYGGGVHTKSAKCDKSKTKGHVDNPYVAEIATLTQNVTELKSDIERHIAIASQLATEVEELRADRERLITRGVFEKELEKLGERLPAVRLLLEQSIKHQSAKFDNWAPHLQADAYRRLGVEPVVMYRRALASPPAAEEPTKCRHTLNQGTTLVGDISSALTCSVCGKPWPDKGAYGGECNRASCHNVPATWKHRDIPRHYCRPCGMLINDNNSDCDPPLCGPVVGDAT